MRHQRLYRLGGLALMLGALMFSLTKARGYVDPDDSLLGVFMLVAFSSWLFGLATLYARYGPVSRALGKTGLGTAVVGLVLLAVGHPFSFMTEVDLFVLIILGSLALMLGALLFGIAALRREVLPRYWRVLPLLTGLIGFAWIFFTNSEGDRLSFMFFRTLFALGWILLWATSCGPTGGRSSRSLRRSVPEKQEPEAPGNRGAQDPGSVRGRRARRALAGMRYVDAAVSSSRT